LAIYVAGGTAIISISTIPDTGLSIITLKCGLQAAYVPGQYVRLAVITRGMREFLSPSHPYTIYSAPHSGVVEIMFVNSTNFGKRLSGLLSAKDGTRRLVCR